MRRTIFLMTAALLVGAVSNANDHAPPPQLSISMFLENYGGPFVSRTFAARLSQLVVEERYPTNVLNFQGVADVVDQEGMWWVKVNVHIPPESPLVSLGAKELTQLTIQIRKTNAEIVSIS
jgi:hypothetical protein